MVNKLQRMKETLMYAIEMQLCNLEEVDTNELGEAIDMLKDLEEAIYYCTVTEAMKGQDSEFEVEMKKGDHHKSDSRMYYDSGYGYDKSGMKGSGDHTGTHYSDYPIMYRDEREGKSYNSRRMYMEAKETKSDKATQLRELEKYMQELSQDIVDMIADASAEEKQYLEKKISALAAKVGQMK